MNLPLVRQVISPVRVNGPPPIAGSVLPPSVRVAGPIPARIPAIDRLGVADRVKGDAFDLRLDEALQKRGGVAIAAASGIVGVIGDDQRLVAGLALAGAGDRLGDREQREALVVAGRPGMVHEFFGDCLPARAVAPNGAIHRHGHRRADIADVDRLNPAQMLTASASPASSSASPRAISSAIGPAWWRPRSSP